MRPAGTGFLCLMTLLLPAYAQAPAPELPNLPAESVTVTAMRPSEAAINDFITTRAAPARVTGKVTRWRTVSPNICKVSAKRPPDLF